MRDSGRGRALEDKRRQTNGLPPFMKFHLQSLLGRFVCLRICTIRRPARHSSLSSISVSLTITGWPGLAIRNASDLLVCVVHVCFKARPTPSEADLLHSDLSLPPHAAHTIVGHAGEAGQWGLRCR